MQIKISQEQPLYVFLTTEHMEVKYRTLDLLINSLKLWKILKQEPQTQNPGFWGTADGELGVSSYFMLHRQR